MILVTGATGLVGAQLVRQLVMQGKPVRALKRSTSDLSLLGNVATKVEWVEGDVTDIFSLEDALKNVTQVYHCAAIISFTPRDVPHMMHVNVDGTANVINAALQTGVQKLLHVSSVAAFGRPQAKEQTIDETLDIKDNANNYHYYRSKLHAEREVWRGMAEGLPATVICPSTILGGGFWNHPPNNLFAKIYTGYPFYSNGINGFVDVRDVAAIAIRAMEGHHAGEKYIVNAANVAFREVMWQIADALQVKRARFKANKMLFELAWRAEAVTSFFTKKEPLITRELASIANEKYHYNNTKVIRTFNFQFRNLNNTITETAQLYLQSLREGKNYGIIA